jgi:hypothetical protein
MRDRISSKPSVDNHATEKAQGYILQSRSYHEINKLHYFRQRIGIIANVRVVFNSDIDLKQSHLTSRFVDRVIA